MKRNLLALGLFVLLSAGYLIPEGGDKLPITTKSESAKNYFLQAREMSDKQKAPEALDLYNKAIQEDPDFALAYVEKSLFDNSGKDFVDDVNKAVALRDKVSDGEKLLIDAQQENLNGNPTKAVEYLEKAVLMFPNDERVHYNLASVQFGSQNYDKALPELKKAIEINSQFSPAYNILGYVYKGMGNFPEAENAFKKYIAMLPNDPNPYDSYAELLLKEGKFDESIQNYQKSLSIDPSFNSSKSGIFAAHLYQGKFSEARDQVNTFLQNAKTNTEKATGHRMLAVSYAYEGNYDQALSELDKEYQVNQSDENYPDLSNVLLRMGNVLYENGQFDKANEKFRAALDASDKSASTQEGKDNFRNRVVFSQNLVALKQQNTNTLAGAKSEDKVVNVLNAKTDAQAQLSHQLNAIAAIEQKDQEVALNELKQANQNDPYVYYLMGRAYQIKGDNQNAKIWFDKAINNNELPNLNSAFAQLNAKKYYNGMK